MPLPAKAASRAAAVLTFVAAHPGQRFRLSDFARELNINNASIHAVLSALVESGLLVRTEDKTFHLGYAAIGIGSVARQQNPDIDTAIWAAEAISNELGKQVAVVRREDNEIVVQVSVHPKIEGGAPSASQLTRTGVRLPLAAPYGAIHMAWEPPNEVLAWIQAGGIAPTGPEAEHIRSALGYIRERGWSASALATEEGDMALAPIGLVEPQPGRKLLLAGVSADQHVGMHAITVPIESQSESRLALSVIDLDPSTGDRLVSLARRIADHVHFATKRVLV